MIDCRKCQYDPICHVPQKHETGCENYKEATEWVKVVRCKDCKYFHLFDEGFRDCRHTGGLNDAYPDDFCSYGERKKRCVK